MTTQTTTQTTQTTQTTESEVTSTQDERLQNLPTNITQKYTELADYITAIGQAVKKLSDARQFFPVTRCARKKQVLSTN